MQKLGFKNVGFTQGRKMLSKVRTSKSVKSSQNQAPIQRRKKNDQKKAHHSGDPGQKIAVFGHPKK